MKSLVLTRGRSDILRSDLKQLTALVSTIEYMPQQNLIRDRE